MSFSSTTEEAIRATPSVTAGGMILMGVPLEQWVLVGSLVLIVLQVFFLLRDKVYRPWRDTLDRSNQP